MPSKLTKLPAAIAAFALMTSRGSGFFFCGIIELPVEYSSDSFTMPNSGVEKTISVCAIWERWFISAAILKAKQCGCKFPINGNTRAIRSPAAKRTAVMKCVPLTKAFHIPLHNRRPSQKHVPKGRHHGVLMVGKSRHGVSFIPLRELQKCDGKREPGVSKRRCLIPQIHFHITCALVIAGPASMELSRFFNAIFGSQPRLNRGMHIFLLRV